jgi:hypothetical protein
MKTRRRHVLLGATAALAAAGSLPNPSELTMATSWPA